MAIRNTDLATWAATAVAVSLPIALGTFVVDELAARREADRAESRAHDVLLRTEAMSDQMLAAFDAMDRGQDRDPCSSRRIALMKHFDLSSSYIQAVGYAEGNVMQCSSLADTQSPVDLGPPSARQPTGILLRQDVPVDVMGKNRYLIVQRGHAIAILHKDLALDIVPVDTGFSLAVVAHAGHVLTERGHIKREWVDRLLARRKATFGEDGRAVSVEWSRRYYFGAIAATPPRSIAASRSAMGRVVYPAAAMASIVMLLLVARLSSRQQSLAATIRTGLKRNEFYLVYQPVVDLVTGRWVGAEALMRWQRRSGDLVPPDLFIPAATQSRLIGAITRRLIEMAGHDFRDALGRYPDFYLALNLSAQDLQDPATTTLCDNLAFAMRAAPHQLMIEATEHGFSDESKVSGLLGKLRDAGMRVAIDDFGTGFSNLARLESLEVDVLKIDKSFVHPIGKGAATSSVILHIIQMGKSLGLVMVAEGVETQAQANFLREQGVQFAQGWLYAKPMDAEAILEELARQLR